MLGEARRCTILDEGSAFTLYTSGRIHVHRVEALDWQGRTPSSPPPSSYFDQVRNAANKLWNSASGSKLVGKTATQ
jgi:hypothetical protein